MSLRRFAAPIVLFMLSQGCAVAAGPDVAGEGPTDERGGQLVSPGPVGVCGALSSTYFLQPDTLRTHLPLITPPIPTASSFAISMSSGDTHLAGDFEIGDYTLYSAVPTPAVHPELSTARVGDYAGHAIDQWFLHDRAQHAPFWIWVTIDLDGTHFRSDGHASLWEDTSSGFGLSTMRDENIEGTLTGRIELLYLPPTTSDSMFRLAGAGVTVTDLYATNITSSNRDWSSFSDQWDDMLDTSTGRSKFEVALESSLSATNYAAYDVRSLIQLPFWADAPGDATSRVCSVDVWGGSGARCAEGLCIRYIIGP